MAFLTLGGVEWDVQSTGAGEEQGDDGANEDRAIDGSLIEEYEFTKRTWSFALCPMSEATYQTLRALHRTRQTASGDFVGNVATTVRVLVPNAEYISDGNIGALRIPTLDLTEV